MVINSIHRCVILEDDFRSVLKVNPNISSHVARLLFRCRPSAVRRLVVSIVVYAVERVFRRWAISHVCQKIFKLEPPAADRYSTSTVIAKSFGARLVAATNHVAPDSVFVRDAASTSAVLELGLYDHLSPKASAALCVTRAEPLRFNYRFVSASAQTNPRAVLELVRRPAPYRSQAGKYLARNIKCFHDCQLYGWS